MELAEARSIVRESLRPMLHALGLQAWKIDVFYETIKPAGRTVPEGFQLQANVSINEPYQKAQITVDPQAHESRAALLQSLRHELLHIVIGPLQTFADAADRHAVEHSENILRAHYHECVERAVLCLERALDWGQNLSPARLVARGRKVIGGPQKRRRRR